MIKIVEINNNNYGSTGNIMLNIAKEARNKGYEVYTACKNSKQAKKFFNPNHIYIGIWLERIVSERLAYFIGLKNHFNVIGTLLFIKKLKSIHPNLVHMHNMHDTYLNLNLLFTYLSKNNIPVVWTFHDCWPITGQCTYFDMAKCNKWIDGCNNCPQIHKHPDTRIDKTNTLWKEKKKWFNKLNNLTIVAPSIWLSNLIRKSFLSNHLVKVINNGIDLERFKPIPSTFRNNYKIENKIILLGVAYNWTERKGIDVFIELSKLLPNKYQIVLVGTNDEIDSTLPDNIISIHKTYNQEELIEIYSACDLFINPTREENFPTVNIEAMACGLPVITFNTGGAGEMISNESGKIIAQNNIKELIDVIQNYSFNKKACIKQASLYSSKQKFNEYIDLYDSLLKQ